MNDIQIDQAAQTQAQGGYSDSPSDMIRENPEVDDARCANVKEILSNIKAGEQRWDWPFKRMDEDIAFVNGKQWAGQTRNDERAVINICQRHVRNRIAALYARNPKAVVKRRPKLDFVVWDEKPESLQMATMDVEMATQAGIQPSPVSLAILNEVTQVKSRRILIDNIARTQELLFQHTIDSRTPNFKRHTKRMVTRSIITGIGWTKLDFKRAYDISPETVRDLGDHRQRLARLESLMADAQDKELEEYSAEADHLRLMIQGLEKSERNHLAQESVVFSWPRSQAIILDPKITSIIGYENCDWLAEKFVLTAEQVKDVYKIDLASGYTKYDRNGHSSSGISTLSPEYMQAQQDSMCCVYEYYDKKTGLVYTVMDGYDDFLETPHEPNATVDQFFPYFPLILNDLEEDDDIYPKGDVRLLRFPQKEYNRSTEALRQHRIARRPAYATFRGAFDEEDEVNLATHNDHDVLILNALNENQKIADILQEIPKANIDPNVYETGTIMGHFQRIAGAQGAELGDVSGATATEVGTASATTQLGTSSNSDDVDEYLSYLAEAVGKVMMMEYSEETVRRIVGNGAIWPEQRMPDVMEEIHTSTRAGSAGRPNMDQEVAKWERATPLLVQIPGVRPDWVARKLIGILDENIDITEAYLDGLPSIMSQNRNMGQMTMMAGDQESDPNMQGGEGGDNQEQGPRPEPGPQAENTQPMDMIV